jgi:hypothetical protein
VSKFSEHSEFRKKSVPKHFNYLAAGSPVQNGFSQFQSSEPNATNKKHGAWRRPSPSCFAPAAVENDAVKSDRGPI